MNDTGRDQERSVRVLLMSPQAPPPGGIESWTSHVLEFGARYGLDVGVINMRSPNPDFGDRFAFFKLRFALGLLKRCRRACAGGGFDVMHINCSFRRWSATRDYGFLRLAQANGMPVVVHLRGGLAGGTEWSSYPLLAKRLYRALLESADTVIALADEVIRDLEAAGIRPRRLVKIPNFLPDDWIENLPAPGSERHGVLYTGRLMKEKGLGTLLELAERLPELEFHWVGRMQDPLELPGNVIWHGEVPHEEMAEYYARCAIYLFPTDWAEGFPNTVLEAMAAGLPIVSTPRAAIPEMVADGEGGFLHRFDDVESMARDLERLAGDSRLRSAMGEFNRRRVEERYLAHRVLPQLGSLYRELTD